MSALPTATAQVGLRCSCPHAAQWRVQSPLDAVGLEDERLVTTKLRPAIFMNDPGPKALALRLDHRRAAPLLPLQMTPRIRTVCAESPLENNRAGIVGQGA